MAEVEHFDRVSKNEDLLKKDEQSPAQKLLNESMDYLKVHKDDLMIDAGMALLAVGTVAGIAKAAAKLESSLFRNGFLVSANDMKHELTFGGLSMPENPLGVGSKFGAAKSSEPKLIFDDKATLSQLLGEQRLKPMLGPEAAEPEKYWKRYYRD